MNVKILILKKISRNKATSLYKEGHNISRVDIVKERYYSEFENLYLAVYRKEYKEEILDICRQYSAIINKDDLCD